MSEAHQASINSRTTSIDRLVGRRKRLRLAIAQLPADAPAEKRAEYEAELADIQAKLEAAKVAITAAVDDDEDMEPA
jgi:putative hemolysin